MNILLNPQQQAGRCDEVVQALLDTGLEGVRRDGVWTGKTSRWGATAWRYRSDARGRPIHVWIEKHDGTVIDPTRWVFEGAFPYIYEGEADFYAAAVLPIEAEME